MKNNQLQKNDDAGRIARAMEEKLQGRTTQAWELREQVDPVARSLESETYELHCYCAKFDQPYTLVFTRQTSGLFRHWKSVRGPARGVPGPARAGGGTIRLDRFESGATPCAWCGDASFHHCANDCGQLVCGGRMVGNTFHCRESCRAVWVGVPLQEVHGAMQQQHRQSMAAPPRPVTPMAPRPAVSACGKPVLLLTAGKNR